MKRMLISVDLEESRAAVIESGKLTHLEIEPVSRDTVKGNIYRGVIARVEPSLQSAFVDFGRDKQGFLPVGEIHPRLKPDNADKRAPIQELIRAGQQIIVQVQRDEIGNKGATLSSFISLPGRYLVLMPESDKTGISRKLSDSAREHIKELTDTMKVPDGMGLIVRTAGETATKLELSKDLVYLNRLWDHIQEEGSKGKGASLLYQERSLAIRFVRDYYRRDIEEIVIDDDDAQDEVSAYLSVLMPKNVHCIERYAGTVPLFARYGVQSQVEDVFSRQVPLPSGGSIVIDQTEALVAVDVNSGRVKGRDIEETAMQTNIEAAQEVARQLVLRDLGGLVVIDFIDMRDRKAVRDVEAALKNGMKLDKARHKIGRISEFGLMELSRQRLKSSVNKGAFESCEHCSGTGFARTPPSVAASVLRRIYELVAKGGVSYVVAQVPPEAAAFLLNNKRGELSDIERQYHVSVEVVAVEGLTGTQVTIEHLSKVPEKSGADRLKVARFDRVVQQVDLVRNRLLKREETRIERQLQKHLSGSRIDYAEVYKDVGEYAVDARAEEAVAEAKRKTAASAITAAPARTAPNAQSMDAYDDEPVPQPGGIAGWLRNLFGRSKPAPAHIEPAVVQAHVVPPVALPRPVVAAPTPVRSAQRGASPASQSADASSDRARPTPNRDARGEATGRGRPGQRDERDEDDSDDESRQRRRRRGGRRRDRDEEGGESESERPKLAAATAVADTAESASQAIVEKARNDDETSADGSDDSAEEGRRRRRRGGRRRRGRREEEETAEVTTASVDGETQAEAAGLPSDVTDYSRIGAPDGDADDAGDDDNDGAISAAVDAGDAVDADDAAADAGEDGGEAAAPAAKPARGSRRGARDGRKKPARGVAAAEKAAAAASSDDHADQASDGDGSPQASLVASADDHAEGSGESVSEANGLDVAIAASAGHDADSQRAAADDSEAAVEGDENVEMTDASALAAAEISRLRAAEALGVADDVVDVPELLPESSGRSRYVIDLRSGGGS